MSFKWMKISYVEVERKVFNSRVQLYYEHSHKLTTTALGYQKSSVCNAFEFHYSGDFRSLVLPLKIITKRY